MPKNSIIYICENCNFKCCKKSNYEKHILTSKHLNTTADNKKNDKKYTCECNKIYNHRASLYNHKKKCIISIKETEKTIDDENSIVHNTSVIDISSVLDASNNEIKVLTNLVLELVKSNADLQKQVLDVCQKIQPANIINNNNTTNSNNKTFNLNFFLNEQCKDAMNLKDFVNSFQLNLDDLERVGQHGYVDGIAYIINKKLKETDIYKRPFHCSDAKRETLYVKDDNVWEKEGIENLKMVKAVKDVGQKNFNVLNDYRLLHPDCLKSESEYNDKYIKLMIQAVGSQKENVNKVIKKIAKEIVIEKDI